ncbi:Uncharacterised protein [Burkholderia pseudomallei]|nr:Uncharacterised protein [Burkholderia pseudomallei]CAJ8381947.1 Uncharacterised protein [Burkholderia pseudomallei]CAJ9807453.1 Uncharacterised protein [Burkholderia pseudomallei]
MIARKSALPWLSRRLSAQIRTDRQERNRRGSEASLADRCGRLRPGVCPNSSPSPKAANLSALRRKAASFLRVLLPLWGGRDAQARPAAAPCAMRRRLRRDLPAIVRHLRLATKAASYLEFGILAEVQPDCGWRRFECWQHFFAGIQIADRRLEALACWPEWAKAESCTWPQWVANACKVRRFSRGDHGIFRTNIFHLVPASRRTTGPPQICHNQCAKNCDTKQNNALHRKM